MRKTTATIILSMSFAFVANAQQGDMMPTSQQNALIQKHCVMCHNDEKLMGGLSLKDFDAARPDPSVAGMMVSKLEGGAMGAANIPQPDEGITAALIRALAASSAIATQATGGWTLRAFNDATTRRPVVTATMVVGAYELTLRCEKSVNMTNQAEASHASQMQVTGPAGTSSAAPRFVLPVSSEPLRVGPVAFSFAGLTPTVRKVLSTCMESKSQS